MKTFRQFHERATSQDKDIKDREGTQPAKYYAKDAEGDEMSKSTKAARARHFEKGAKKDDDDPSAYKPAPGDKSAKTKPSKYTKKYQQMFGDKDEDFQLDEKIEGLVNKSEKSGISYSILKKVYDRGMAAYKTGHRPGTTPQQWAFARVNSFIVGGKTRTTADADLWKQHKGKSEESEDLREIGKDYADHTRKVTPGYVKKLKTESCCESCDEHFDHVIMESEYQGRKVQLNNPFRTPGGPKKFSVYVKNEKGNVVKVNFGDPNMEIKRDNPARRKSFRARHNCDNPGPKWKARYWSCYQWRARAKVDN